ncbi:MAG: hypothetical protein II622_04055 [Thermoguttaceae bacterium]|nr:hypothetical protein [Thermoguttaceae bacterium]
MKYSALTVLAALALVCCASQALAKINLWPVPEGEPVSQFWSVEVDGQNAGVLTASTADPPFKKYDYGGEYAFLSVDADEPVTFKIKEKTGANLDSLVVRPQSLGIKPVMNDDGTFSITVDKPCQFSVEYDGRVHPLLIFVNAPEENVPSKDDADVVYYGPGVHRADKIELHDGQTLYLAPGAIVQGGIYVSGKDVAIRGRGVLDSTPWEWRKGPTGHVVEIYKSQNVLVEGIIIRGASRWTVVPVASEDVTVRNIKLCGGRVQNDDGINPCNSRRVHVSNCFIRTDDDCMALKGLDVNYGNCEDVTVENCVFWCDRARIVLMGHESRAPYMRRVVFKNIDVIHSQTRNFLLEPGELMRMEDVTFDGIRFETGKENALSPEALEKMKNIDTSALRFDIDVANKDNWLFVGRPTVNQYMKTQEPGYIKNVTIRNITVTGPASYCGILFSGADEEYTTEGLTIENFSLFGEKQTQDSPLIHIGDFISGVEVK